MTWRDKLRRFWARLGPGLITGASDDDPSGIATYSLTGASVGYGLSWTALWSWPFMAAIQETCARIGLVTGLGIAGLVRARYGRRLLAGVVCLMLVASALNIGADLSAMAESLKLLAPAVPAWVFSSALAALIFLAMVRWQYGQIAGVLKWLALSLLAYVFVAFATHQDWSKLALAAVVPHLEWNRDFIMLLVGVMGTTISPYLFFWQASEEVEERQSAEAVSHRPYRVCPAALREMRADVFGGMMFSNVAMFFIIAASASAFHAAGTRDLSTVAQVASALRPVAGDFAYLLFALGAVGTGLLAIPVLAGSVAYLLAEFFVWKEGLSTKFAQARKFYLAIGLVIAAGWLLSVAGFSPVSLLFWTAVFYGVISPPLLLVILKVANDRAVMGPHVSGRWSNLAIGTAAIIMTAAALALGWFTLIQK